MATSKRIPIAFLKTKSSPTDNYQEFFSKEGYEPTFVPVLDHQFSKDGLAHFKKLVGDGHFKLEPPRNTESYGGLIFTSQRAVEAFSQVVSHLQNAGLSPEELLPSHLFIYIVGPATGKSIRALNLPCGVFGDESGNGEALAEFILEHYNQHVGSSDRNGMFVKPRLLFVVGEKRRDIIPRMLQAEALPSEQRITVDEVTVYETAVKQSFASDFQASVQSTGQSHPVQWIVVFSPTGCKVMLEQLGLLNSETGKAVETVQRDQGRALIATIGPTTRDYLVREFSFEPDVCSSSPSPEGLGDSIARFETHNPHLFGS